MQLRHRPDLDDRRQKHKSMFQKKREKNETEIFNQNEKRGRKENAQMGMIMGTKEKKAEKKSKEMLKEESKGKKEALKEGKKE